MWRRSMLVAAVAVSLLVSACSSSGSSGPTETSTTIATPDGQWSASIRWTSHGIPHITAGDPANLGFGQGWAAAVDRGCELADQIVKVRGERARWHGAGDTDRHLHGDLAYRAWDLRGRAEQLLPTLTDDARALIEGYAAGFSAWLAEVGADGVGGWCAGAPWLAPIDAVDLLAYHYDLAMLMSGRRYVDAVAEAAPPDASLGVQPYADAGSVGLPAPVPIDSVTWAFGREATGSTTSILAAASAFPWDGELALWENRLTIPGRVDVSGVSLVGLPGVLSGFTEHMAWNQVPAPGERSALGTVDLVAGRPTAYLVDGVATEMTPTSVTVEVAGRDGASATEERTVWSTSMGPVVVLPGLGWGTDRAVVLRDAALDAPLLVEQSWAFANARTTGEFDAAAERYAGVGWAATLGVSASGWATFVDAGATPAVSDEAVLAAIVRTTSDPVAAAVAAEGGVLLDFSDAATFVDPGSSPRAVRSRDWLVAASESTWALNGEIRLESGAALSGPRRQPLGVTTRHALRSVAALVADARERGVDLGGDEVAAALVANDGLLSASLRDGVVERCRAAGPVTVPANVSATGTVLWDAQDVVLSETCDLLERWRGTWNLEDQATNVWVEFLARFESAELVDAGRLWAVGFDPADPLGTPSGLAPAPPGGVDPIAVALAEASLAVQAAGFEIDDFWRDVQWTERGGERVPVHGGTGLDGTTLVGRFGSVSTSMRPPGTTGDLLDARSGLRRGGRPVDAGTSAVMVIEVGPWGVRGRALLPGGQSGDPASPFHADQAYRYSDKAWRPMLVEATDVAANTIEQRDLLVPRG